MPRFDRWKEMQAMPYGPGRDSRETAHLDHTAVEVGERLRLRREEIGASQADLGVVAGVHRATIRAVETGKSVELRTLANVKRALGCALTADKMEVGVLRPVLTARAAGIIIAAILKIGGDSGGSALAEADAEQRRLAMIDDYFELVDSLSMGVRLPDSYARFMQQLSDLMPPSNAEFVHQDVKRSIPPPRPPDYQLAKRLRPESRQSRHVVPGAHVGLWKVVDEQRSRSEIEIIAESGLPAEAKEALVAHMLQRRREMEQAIRREAAVLVQFVGAEWSLGNSVVQKEILPRINQIRGILEVRRFGTGYNPAQVDSLLDEVERLVRQGISVAEGLLDTRSFDVLPGGYYEDLVDAGLGDIRERLAAANLLTPTRE